MSGPRITVLGAGRWGINHVRTLAQLGALAAVVDPAPGAAERVAAVADVPVHPDPTPVWEDPTIAGVVVATPADRHPADTLAALAAGKHVLVEKPMALDVRAAREMATAAEQAGRILMVGHLLLYQPAITWLREAIADGRFGEVRHVETRRLNLGTVRSVENAFWSLAPHDLAVIHHLLDAPELTGVAAQGRRLLGRPLEDMVEVWLDFGDGRSASVVSAWWWPRKERATTVLGTAGLAQFDEVAGRLLWQPARVHDGDEGPVLERGEAQVVELPGGAPLEAELRHFRDCIATGRRPISDAAQGVAVVEMLARVTEEVAGVRG